jgi:hypothetical protein
MGAVRQGVPVALATQLRDELGLATAIETGTFRGASARQLASLFSRVWTIEWSEQLWAQARERLLDQPGITCLQGSSADVIGDAIESAAGPSLYWLDGHWSGGETAGSVDECPVLAEIGAIDASPHGAGSAVLIDDARLFLSPPPPPHDREQWPSFLDLLDALRAHHKRFVTVVEDVVVAVPLSARRTVEDYGTAVTLAQQAAPGSALVRRLSRRVAGLARH